MLQAFWIANRAWWAMSFPLATVNKILTYSLVDGPGNRLVIFFQGCNFTCATCHNPYTVGVCDNCGDCIPACHADALSMVNGKVVFDADVCDQCDDCLTACPISASPMVQHLSVEDILKIARKHRPFLSGITVSGGEATLHLKFILALFEAVKSDPKLAGLTCFIDTNGHLGPQSWARLMPLTDGVMLDIKAFDLATHTALTGQSNAMTLQAARMLHEAGKLHELRFLVIPERTDTKAERDALTSFIRALNPDIRIRLNAFQHHGVRGDALNIPAMGEAGITELARHLKQSGIKNVIVPALYM